MPASDQRLSNDRYALIPRTLIFITRGDSVLLLRGDPDKDIWPDQYNGVGGHIEPGEDVLSAAHRELKEETGLEDQPLHLVGTVTIDTGQDRGVGLYVFKGEYQGGEISPSQEGHIAWVSREQISSLPVVEDLPVLLSRVMGTDKEDPPFSAHYYYAREGSLVIQFADSPSPADRS
jgi:8-oxo-dGTP diphosphatase